MSSYGYMGIIKDIQTLFTKKNATPASNVGLDQDKYLSTIPQKKVLIVEDEKLLANALESKFKHENFTVFKAENGQQGLDMAVANKPDIILLDLMMPVMDGKTMLHKLRELPDFKYLPVVVLTNAGEVDNMRETKTFDNASAFLIKSNVNPEDIVQVVRDSIR